jgi:hypothetical protein
MLLIWALNFSLIEDLDIHFTFIYFKIFIIKIRSTLTNGQVSYYQNCAKICEPSSSDTYNLKCCKDTNCNSVTVAPRVVSCYVGGNFKDLNTGETFSQKVEPKACVSPKNSFCVASKGSYSNRTMDVYFCSDECVEGLNKVTGIFTTCCFEKENCNFSSGGQRKFSIKLNLMLAILFSFFNH